MHVKIEIRKVKVIAESSPNERSVYLFPFHKESSSLREWRISIYQKYIKESFVRTPNRWGSPVICSDGITTSNIELIAKYSIGLDLASTISKNIDIFFERLIEKKIRDKMTNSGVIMVTQ